PGDGLRRPFDSSEPVAPRDHGRGAGLPHRLVDDLRGAAVVRSGDHGLDGEDGLGPRGGAPPRRPLGIPAGSLIARLGAKRTMNVADAARVPLMAAIPVLHWTGHLTFPALLGFTFLLGCFMAPYYSSSRLILPEVLGEDEQLVAQGSAFVLAANQLTQLGGPILAGLLIAWIGASGVLLIDAATYAFSFVVILVFVRAGKRVAGDESSRGLFAGLRYVLHDRLLGPMMAAVAFINFAAQGLIAMLP